MSTELLIDRLAGETRIALLRSGRLREIVISRDDDASIAGNVYLGKVERVVPGIAAAFVDLGEDRAGFLAARDARILATKVGRQEQSGPPNIENLVHEGQWLTVQVLAAPTGGKGARLSTEIALPGQYLVFRPRTPGITVSRRIEDEGERDRLCGAVRGAGDQDEGGFIVRTAAQDVSAEVLESEAGRLIDAWNEIEDAQEAGKPRLLYREHGAIEKALRDWAGGPDVTVKIEGPSALGIARLYAATHAPDLAGRLQTHDGDGGLFEQQGVEEEIEIALGARVPLPRGGWLMIEATEALTAIDVNAGSRSEGAGREETARGINLAAVREIARQLRLRNIGGLIVIDLIDMRRDQSWKKVLDELRSQLAHDRAATHVSDTAAMGLATLTRRRSGPSLGDLMTEPREGRRKTAAAVGHEILRRAAREAMGGRPGNLLVSAQSEVAQWLAAKYNNAGLEAEFGRAMIVEADPDKRRADFELSIQGAD